MMMQHERIAFEYYRLQVVDEWPDCAARQAVLAAIRFRLASLLSAATAPV
jgi:hypothetical protein